MSLSGEAQSSDIRTDVASEAWTSEVEAALPPLMAEASVPGLSLAVIKDSRLAWRRGFGVANADTGASVRPETVFQAASLSKPVVAYAALRLVDRGMLELDRSLASYLPYRYAEDQRTEAITVRMVLSHTTGFPNWRDGVLRLHFEPGRRFSYSGEAYVYLQFAIEEITGRPLDAVLHEEVFEPLGMTRSGFVWRESFRRDHAEGHGNTGKVQRRAKSMSPNAAASLYTTAEDYARFMVAVLRGSGLSASSREEMLTPQVGLQDCLTCLDDEESKRTPNGSMSWGLGWGLQETQDGRSIWHWGDNGVFKSYVVAFPRIGTGLVYFSNGTNGLAIRNAIVAKTLGGTHPAFEWLGYEQK